MQIKIPHFKYSTTTDSNNHALSIEADGELIHNSNNTDEFYKIFGYDQVLKNSGVLPEEFISKEYVKDNEFNYYFASLMTQR